ncbi:hypothetical protein TNIN_441051, partial [Trichonephila inaurata madagascariensis]
VKTRRESFYVFVIEEEMTPILLYPRVVFMAIRQTGFTYEIT